MDVLSAIREHLRSLSLEYREIHHEPTPTSEDSARARGEELRVGGKALLLKTGDAFRLFVLSAARKLDAPAVKSHLAVKKLRFATPEELLLHTGLVPGSVPPFGRPILPFDLFVDHSVFAHERIAFNAGSLTDSIVMSVADYRVAAQPRIFSFSEPAPAAAPESA